MISSKIEPTAFPVHLLGCLSNNLKERFSKEQPCLRNEVETNFYVKLDHENVKKKESPKQYRKSQ